MSMAVTCLDILWLGHDHDGWQSFNCMLEAGHDGPHRDEFEHDGKSVVVTWHADNEEE